MAWNGSGTFQRTNGTYSGATVWQDDKNAGFDIVPARVDTHDQDLAVGINNCLTKDGQNQATGPMNLGNNRIINVGTSTSRSDAPQVAQVQDGDFIWLGTTGGTATAMTASASPAITAYKNGQKFRMKPGLDSTGVTYTSHTLAINGLAASAIIHQDGNSPTLGSWLTGTGRVLELVRNDGFFVIVSAPQYYQSWTPVLTPQAGSISGLTVSGVFIRLGNAIHFNFNATYTQNTASANYIDVTLPVRPSATQWAASGSVVPNVTVTSAQGLVASVAGSGTLRCYAFDQQALLTGGGKQLTMSGTYQIG